MVTMTIRVSRECSTSSAKSRIRLCGIRLIPNWVQKVCATVPAVTTQQAGLVPQHSRACSTDKIGVVLTSGYADSQVGETLLLIPITDSLRIRIPLWNAGVYAMKGVRSRFRELREDSKRRDDNRQHSLNVFATIVHPYQYKPLKLLMECTVSISV